MNSNVGATDRTIRVIAGIVLLSLFYLLEGNARWFGLIGIVLIGTGLISFCPIYKLLGLRTNSNKSS